MKVKDKIFVVTGGGSGIGRALVLNLLEKDVRVAAVDVNQAALDDTAALAGDRHGRLATYAADITDREAVAALPERVLAKWGAVDGIINNAGIIQPFLNLSETGYDMIRQVMDVNFFGTLYMVKEFLPYLTARPQAHITNVSSMGGFFAVPGQTVYGASKAAVKILTEGLWSELKNTKVRVMMVFPGGIRSNIMQNSGAAMSKKMEKVQKVIRLTSPEKAAGTIIRGIESNRYRLPVGFDAALLDFICRMDPNRSERWLYQLMKAVLYD